MKKFLSVFCLFTIVLFSQNKEINRLEFDLNEDYERETIYPLEGNGFLLQSFAKNLQGGMMEIKNDFYTTDLKLEKTISLKVKDGSFINDSFYDKGINYVFLRARNGYFAIIIFDSNKGECKKIEGSLPGGKLYDMKVADEVAVFRFVKKNESKMLFINLNTSEVSETTFELEKVPIKNIKIKDFQIFDDEILVFLKVKTTKSDNNLYIARLSKSGVKKEMFRIEGVFENAITSVTATQNNGKYLITGTYSTSKREVSNGLYFGEVENGKLNFIKYHNFLDLKNFTDYLSEQKQKKIEKRKENAEKKGKEYTINYNYLIHPVKATEDGYEFLGEAYYATYDTYTTMIGKEVVVRQIFDGYQYSHATLAKFDRNGNIIWDNTFSMWLFYKPFYTPRFIAKRDSGKTVDLVYANYYYIVSKSFDKNSGEVIKDKSKEIIDTEKSGDKLKRGNSKIVYWYDNNFLVYGKQKITNKEIKEKRRVFFVNRYSVD